jgi:hypothetical protein
MPLDSTTRNSAPTATRPSRPSPAEERGAAEHRGRDGEDDVLLSRRRLSGGDARGEQEVHDAEDHDGDEERDRDADAVGRVLGLTVGALVGVQADGRRSIRVLGSSLAELECVDHAVITTGRYDALVEVLCRDSVVPGPLPPPVRPTA